MVATGLSNAGVDAIGFAGGGVLAICLVPQIGKIIITRSTRDISFWWSFMYMIGLTLTLVYLIIKDAMAAWIPLVVEVLGCLIIIALKLFFEHTSHGRRVSAAKHLDNISKHGFDFDPSCVIDASVRSLPGISHVTGMPDLDISRKGSAAAAAAAAAGRDSSVHIRANSGSKHASAADSPNHIEITCGGADSTSSSSGQQQQQQQQQRQYTSSKEEPLFPNGWHIVQPVEPMTLVQQQQQQQ